MNETLQDYRILKGIFETVAKNGPVEQGRALQEKFNQAITENFNKLHNNTLATGGLEQTYCGCGNHKVDEDGDDTRGLENSTYSLKDFLLDVEFPTSAATAGLEDTQCTCHDGGTTSGLDNIYSKNTNTSGLADDTPTEQYKLNQLEFERQERLLQEYQEALTFTPASKSSLSFAPAAA